MGDKRNGKDGNGKPKDKPSKDDDKPSAKRKKKKGRKQGLDKWAPRQQRG